MNALDISKQVLSVLEIIETKLGIASSAVCQELDDLRSFLNVESQAKIAELLLQQPMTRLELAIALQKNEPIIVHFTKNSFFDDDWTDVGSLAKITNVRWKDSAESFEFTVDGTQFESHNLPLMQSCYYSNIHTDQKVRAGLIPEKELYTAVEAEMYKPVFTSYYGAYRNGKEFTPQNSPDTVYMHLADTLLDEIGNFYKVN